MLIFICVQDNVRLFLKEQEDRLAVIGAVSSQ